jgi:uncharacterized protein YndB with AHSA1/START domain
MTATPSVALERILDSPIDLVWQMWTEAEHFAAWYGPAGATVPVLEMDVRVGGRRHFCLQMETPDGDRQMWFVGEYQVVDRPTRLVYTESISDPDGTLVSPDATGMPSDHPEITAVTVELDDLDGRTRIVLTHAGVPADSPGAAGWNMALDKLEAHLAT